MVLPVYPDRHLLPGLTYNQKWSPTFFNQPTATTATGADIDLGLAQYPLHDFELSYELLRHGIGPTNWTNGQGLEFRTMMGFHLQIGGTLGRFLYKNVDDFEVFQNQIGVGDGITTTFTLTRFFGTGLYGASEPIGSLIPGEMFNAYLNGSSSPVLPTLYTLDTSNPCANTITFGTAPPAPTMGNPQTINVDMSYFYYCKLAQNSNTFEKFMERLWLLNKITLHSCRPGA